MGQKMQYCKRNPTKIIPNTQGMPIGIGPVDFAQSELSTQIRNSDLFTYYQLHDRLTLIHIFL